MPSDADRYEAFYAHKLWHLIPEVYRAADAEGSPDGSGPLRELVGRLGAQAAVLRRAIDRAWEDQSPETCDAWAVAYLGDLLATNLLPDLDDRARRLDVAKTIYYRRRKGTLAVLEELASDLTGWDVKVVEFFRRLARARHNFDPPVGGPPRELLVAQGLVGRRSGTPAGGTADLRDASTATSSRTAFDEFAHTADFRRGRGTTGRHGIPKVGVFVWRLTSYGVAPVTPVKVSGTADEYTFDPTGRDVPLFAKGRRGTDAFGRWVSPAEWALSGPISCPLWHAGPEGRGALYPDSLAVLTNDPAAGPHQFVPQPLAAVTEVGPERGRFRYAPAAGEQWAVRYHYGFAADLGAGPYDRRPYRPDGAAFPAADAARRGGDGVGGLPPDGVVELADSLTYAGAAGTVSVGKLTIRAANRMRPVLREAGGTWAFEGTAADSVLELDGLFLSGGVQVALRGTFDRVAIRCCTFDPGLTDPDDPLQSATAADGVPLEPTRLRVEGRVAKLTIDRSVLARVETTGAGRVSFADLSDSVLQSLALPDADACLTRCTVIDSTHARTIDASECLFAGPSSAVDRQRGCLRFSGWAAGSDLPRKFECAELPTGANPFATTRFGEPHYCVLSAAAPAAVREGGEGGREMGAFAAAGWPLKKRGLAAKFAEFLPIGLVPVVIDVT
jgi:hypothetical protein